MSYINPTFPFFSSIFGMLKPRCQRRPCPRRQRSTGPTWTPPPVVMAFRWPRCHITIFPNSCTMLRKWWVSPRKNWGKTGSMKNGVLTTFHPKNTQKDKGMSKAERWLSALVQVESFWNDFIMAAQKSRGDWPSLRKRSQAMADAWDLKGRRFGTFWVL